MKKYWRESDENNLIAMLASGKSNAQIARSLGRTVSSVQHKRSRMGLTDVRLRSAEQPKAEAAQPSEYEQQTRRELKQALANTIAGLEVISEELKSQRIKLGDLEAAVTTAMEVSDGAIEEAKKMKAELAEERKHTNDIACYLSHGRIWRLFHSFNAYMRKLYLEREKGGKA